MKQANQSSCISTKDNEPNLFTIPSIVNAPVANYVYISNDILCDYAIVYGGGVHYWVSTSFQTEQKIVAFQLVFIYNVNVNERIANEYT